MFKSTYGKFSERFKKRLQRKRKGIGLVELLIYIVVAGIIGVGIASNAGTAPNKANYHRAQDDLRSLSTAVQQAAISAPQILRLTPSSGSASACTEFLEAVNEQLDSQYQFYLVPNAVESGLVGQTKHKDPWGSPYGLYVFFNTPGAKKYVDASGTALTTADSCVIVVVASAGRNTQGLLAGLGGANLDGDSNVISAKDALINTDGVDDVGVICRIKNGDFATAMFGVENTGLGDLKGIQWILGWEGETGNGGKACDFANAGADMSVTYAGSIDQFPDAKTIKDVFGGDAPTGTAYSEGLIGAWVTG